MRLTIGEQRFNHPMIDSGWVGGIDSVLLRWLPCPSMFIYGPKEVGRRTKIGRYVKMTRLELRLDGCKSAALSPTERFDQLVRLLQHPSTALVADEPLNSLFVACLWLRLPGAVFP
jgi:hypothetical protein